MSTVAQNLQTLAAIKEDIRQAIVTKGQTCPVGTPFADYADKIEAISGGGDEYEEQPIKDVTFFDYDGRVPYSYTAQEFLALEALPSLPTHEGLTAQGWNWTLADAQAHVRKYKQLNIGAHYVTDTGETRLYISLLQGMEYQLWLTSTDRANTRIDWGDGTTTEGVGTSSNTHTYVNGGNYVIKIYPPENGTVTLGNNASYCLLGRSDLTLGNGARLATAIKIEIGSRTNIADYGLGYLYNLKSVTMPSTATVGNSVISNSSKLRYITIPTNTGAAWARYGSYGLEFISLPHGVTDLVNGFNASQFVRRITLPDTTTNIPTQNMYGHQCVDENYIPELVTNIGNQAFGNNQACMAFYVYPTTPPTLGTNAFQNINANAKIYVPHGKLNDYQTAENWAAYASYMVEMSE